MIKIARSGLACLLLAMAPVAGGGGTHPPKGKEEEAGSLHTT